MNYLLYALVPHCSMKASIARKTWTNVCRIRVKMAVPVMIETTAMFVIALLGMPVSTASWMWPFAILV